MLIRRAKCSEMHGATCACNDVARSGRHLFLRLTALGLSASLFYQFEWYWLCELMRDSVLWSLVGLGFAPQACTYQGSPALRIGDQVFLYTRICTYVDMLLALAALRWLRDGIQSRTVTWIVVVSLGVETGNVARSTAALWLHLNGVKWLFAHDLPNHAMWVGVLSLGVLANGIPWGSGNGQKRGHSLGHS